MDRRAADELDVVVPLLDGPLGGLADQGERLDEQAVERVPLAGLEAELGAPGLELVVGLGFEGRFEGVDLVGQHGEPPEPPRVRRRGDPLDLVQPLGTELARHDPMFSSEGVDPRRTGRPFPLDARGPPGCTGQSNGTGSPAIFPTTLPTGRLAALRDLPPRSEGHRPGSRLGD